MRGFININKTDNMTSSDVVVKVRGILRKATGEKQKVGHFGTLDPMGTGVLPIAVGNATRLFDYSINKVKVYQTRFKFGFTTDTLDTTGKIIEQTDNIPSKDEILAVLGALVGKQDQIPPLYSAKSINGKRAYDLAREGKSFELQPRAVEIYSIIMIGENADNNEYSFEIKCSGGTYIRSIARDMGSKLNSLAVMASIHRIRSGEFTIDNAISIDEFAKDPIKYIMPIDVALNGYEKYVVPNENVSQVLNGVKLSFDNLPNDKFVAVCNEEICGIAENVEGKLVIRTRI